MSWITVKVVSTFGFPPSARSSSGAHAVSAAARIIAIIAAAATNSADRDSRFSGRTIEFSFPENAFAKAVP
ncbi:hypothetical protein [Corynebacterium tuberculostearicum]|uniref:hypothetical protein n=1 Tax=Corynebacterium tuberculostearicum TaxID=38304 RepID=UPI002542CF91|nr:hypothetical protein [Corynebacterium tuberculostearicum]MDK4231577.1 hypothetical protein [Corynebacterium tuberculostearicum]